MRTKSRRRVFGAAFAATALVLAACSPGSGEDATVPDGPTITVASFNFPESVILAEIYAQALEDGGYPIERNLNLGSRELIFPEIESGAIGFLPEYLGSSIGVGFGETPPNSTSDAVAMLSDLFSAEGERLRGHQPVRRRQQPDVGVRLGRSGRCHIGRSARV